MRFSRGNQPASQLASGFPDLSKSLIRSNHHERLFLYNSVGMVPFLPPIKQIRLEFKQITLDVFQTALITTLNTSNSVPLLASEDYACSHPGGHSSLRFICFSGVCPQVAFHPR